MTRMTVIQALLSSLALSIAAAFLTTTPAAASVRTRNLVSSTLMAEWHNVAVCETGARWAMRGPLYSGALGILNTNWARFAPRQFPRNAADATPQQQVYVAAQINRGFPIPDQNGCHPW